MDREPFFNTFIEGLWPHAFSMLVFAVSVGALTLDQLRESTIAILTVLACGVLFF